MPSGCIFRHCIQRSRNPLARRCSRNLPGRRRRRNMHPILLSASWTPAIATYLNPEEINPNANALQIVDSENGSPSGVLTLSSKAVEQLAELPEFYVDVASGSPGVEYGSPDRFPS